MISVTVMPGVLGTSSGVSFNVINRGSGWRRSIRAQGGYWQGEFEISGTPDELTRYFYNWLGNHVEERSGGLITWEGLIYEMDLTYSAGDVSVTRKRSLDDLYNAVKCDYTLTDGTPQTTSQGTNDQSIARYGKRETIIEMVVGQSSTNAAEAARNRYLWEHQWPWARAAGVDIGKGETLLRVMVCGYIFTANWRYVTVATGSAGNASTWVNSIVTTDCEFLSVGNIQSNTLQVKPVNTERAYDTIADYTKLGDGTTPGHNPWRFYVSRGRKAYYEQMSTTPLYYLRHGHLYGPTGTHIEADPWRVTPGVVRDTNYPIQTGEYSGWLEDVRDFWIDEIECSVANGLTLRSSIYSESEIADAQMAYADSIRGTVAENPEWVRYGISSRDWERMTPNARRNMRAQWRQASTTQRRRYRRTGQW